MWQQCLALGDSPVQLVSSESATDIMIARLVGLAHTSKSGDILLKVLLQAEL